MSRQGAHNAPLWPGANAPNARPEANAIEFANALQGMFGDVIYTDRPISSVPITAETLQSKSVYLSTAPVVENTWLVLEEVTGWFFRIAPLSKQAYMNNTIMTTTYERRPWERLPEGTVPSYWTHKTDFVKFNMQRYEYSLKFEGDFWFYGAAHAKEIYSNSLKNMYSNWIITMKMYIEKGLIQANLPLWEQFHTRNPPFKNIAEATRLPRGAYCALSRDQKGLYLCTLEAQSYSQDNQFTYDTLVVPHGTMDRIATNDYHTEASRIGDSRAYTMLTNGGKMLKNVNGIDIYENTRWNLDGVPMQDIEGFVHSNMHGGYIYNDADMGFIPGDNVNMRYGFEYIDSCSSSWMRKDYLTLLRESGRWNNMGNLHDDHYNIINSLPKMLQMNKTTIYNGMLDPFMYRVEVDTRIGSQTETHQDVGNYAVVKVMGEADIRFSSLNRLSEHIKAVLEILETKCCDELRDIKELALLSKRLTEIDTISNLFYEFTQAISLNPENRVSADDGLFFLKVKGSNSAPLPPHRLADASTVFGDGDGNRFKGKEIVFVKDGTSNLYPVFDVVEKEYKLLTKEIILGANTANYQLISAPEEPLSYGMINGLRVLASLYKNVEYRGWNKSTLETAFKGVEALDCLMAKLKDIYTDKNLYFNSKIAPVFMRTGDPELDAMNGAISALWMEFERPYMVRLPWNNNGIWTVSSSKKTRLEDEINIGPLVITILSAMLEGYEPTTVATHDAITAVTNWSKRDMKDFSLMFMMAELGSAKAGLFTSRLGVMKEKFKGYSNSYYARSFANFLRDNYPGIATGYENTFAALVSRYIIPKLKESRGKATALEGIRTCAFLLQALVDLVVEDQLDGEFDEGYIHGIQRKAMDEGPKTDQRKRSRGALALLDVDSKKAVDALNSALPGDQASDPTFGWVNSRLSISHKAWVNYMKEVETIADIGVRSVMIYHIPVRPMSSEDPTKALFSETIEGQLGGAAGDAAMIKRSLDQISYSSAKAGKKSFFEHGAFFFGGDSSQKGRKKGMSDGIKGQVGMMDDEKRFEQHVRSLQFDVYGEDINRKARLPQSLYSSPFPTSTYDDTPSLYAAVQSKSQTPGVDHKTTLQFILSPWIQERTAYLEKNHSNPMEKMIGKLYCLSPVHMDVYESMVRHNVPPYCKGVIQARPWKVDLVAAILFAQSGSDVAESGFFAPIASAQYSGPYNFVHMQFSIWFGLVIKQPHKLLFLTSKVMKRNESGMGGKMLGKPSGNQGVIKSIKERLVDGFIILTGDELRRNEIPSPLNILSERDMEAYPNSGNFGNVVGDGEQHVPGLLFCQSTLRLSDIGAQRFAPRYSLGKVKNNPTINRDCWPESRRLWDPISCTFKMHGGDDYYGDMNPLNATEFLSGKGPLRETKLVEVV